MSTDRLAASGLLVWLCAALLAAAASAEEAPPAPAPEATPTSDWEFFFAPYFWGAGIEGTMEADDHSADLDVSFSDIWDALDAGVLGSFEARKGRFQLTSNLIYMKGSSEASRPRGALLTPNAPPGSFEVRSTLKASILELRPSWEVLSLPLFGEGDARRIALDLGPAARVFWMDSHLHVKREPGVPVDPFSERFDESIDWVDFLGAARVRAQLTEKIRVSVAGDYGGFDIGSSSHRTWSLAGFVSYRLGEHWDLAGGWRTLEIERGAIELEMSGPLLGAIYRF